LLLSLSAASATAADMSVRAYRATVGDRDWWTMAALLRVMPDALAKEIRKLPPDANDLAKRGGRPPVCGPNQTAQDWLNAECSYDEILVSKDHCGSDGRCFAVRLAPFVTGDLKMIGALKAALAAPCRTVKLEDRDHFWLFCDTSSPVTAHVEAKPNGVYLIRYGRGRDRASY
jgi:hypothetical protein